MAGVCGCNMHYQRCKRCNAIRKQRKVTRRHSSLYYMDSHLKELPWTPDLNEQLDVCVPTVKWDERVRDVTEKSIQ